MAESTYKVIELIGTSTSSWEEAARTAVEMAGKSLKDLRVAEVERLDMNLSEGGQLVYRTRVSVSFKYRQ